jgi:hypothetical protein
MAASACEKSSPLSTSGSRRTGERIGEAIAEIELGWAGRPSPAPKSHVLFAPRIRFAMACRRTGVFRRQIANNDDARQYATRTTA